MIQSLKSHCIPTQKEEIWSNLCLMHVVQCNCTVKHYGNKENSSSPLNLPEFERD